MRLTIGPERQIRLETAGVGLEVSGELRPLPMLAASLALCTAVVITTYAETARLNLEGFDVDVRWDMADDPRRVGSFYLTLRVPTTISDGRRRALLRAAETCTVHHTLTHPPRIDLEVVGPA